MVILCPPYANESQLVLNASFLINTIDQPCKFDTSFRKDINTKLNDHMLHIFYLLNFYEGNFYDNML